MGLLPIYDLCLAELALMCHSKLNLKTREPFPCPSDSKHMSLVLPELCPTPLLDGRVHTVALEQQLSPAGKSIEQLLQVI